MQIFILVAAFFGLLSAAGLIIFTAAWRGHGRDWWDTHGDGWIPYIFAASFTIFTPLCTLATIYLVLNTDLPSRESPLFYPIRIILLGSALFVTPIFLWFSFNKPPKVLLPKRIYESRKQGDPEIARRTLWPKGKDPTWGLQGLTPANLPYTANVKYIRSTFEALLAFAGTPLFMWLFTVGLRGDLGRGLYSRMWPLFPLLSIALFLTFLYLARCLLNPSPVTLNEVGVRTREWGVDWPDVRGIRYRNGRLSFLVSPDLAYHYRENNKWYSGRPFGYGGWHAKDDYLHCNPRIKNGRKTRDLAISLMNTYGTTTQEESVSHVAPTPPWKNNADTKSLE
ncbi:hypothetical protein [Kocuria sp.]|uniref:hypothetical protein n=1 Tax=Kocuria sp. TaxID=1871328 RepID=UPI0026DED8F4|nr:hypothetical protein [Kocuria sp.]MDO5617154.1 hypothetical protein [Kocuria sp.]